MTSPDPGRPPLVEAMLDPALYPGDHEEVDLRETHVSWVFLVGDRAYKVKKPVVFPFLDYGTPQRRREMCELEVLLNRRLAPHIYLSVIGIVERDGAYALSDQDDPAAVDYAVEMLRVDEARSLATLARRGQVDEAIARAVGARLARFHAEAPVAPPELCDPAVLAATLDENVTTLRSAGSGVLAPERLDAMAAFTRACFAARRAELAVRGDRGLVRDGHGDLRAEHVIVPLDAPLYVYDCIEFDPALRQIDVSADLAFLVMDLARLGTGDAAFALAEAYRAAGGDPGDEGLLSFFAAYRAWVRAKIACLKLAEAEDEARGRLAGEARSLTALGHRFAWRARRPLVLALCGVTATGKTTLADGLAAASGWPHVSSDLTRKRLAGIDPEQRADPEVYSPEFTLRTYEELGREARRALGAAGGVIADATFHLRAERDAFRAGLGDARTLFVECTAPAEVLRERIRARATDPARVSDATLEVLERQLAAREPLDDAPPQGRAAISTEAELEALVARVEGLVDSATWPAPDRA